MKTSVELNREIFYADTKIFKEGDEGYLAYLIEKGRVEISRYDKESGQKVVLGVLGPNSIFGEMALIDENPRMATAMALEETVCRLIPKDIFEQKISAADPFIQGILRLFAQNIRSLSRSSPPE